MRSVSGASRTTYPPAVLLAVAAVAVLSLWGAIEFYRSSSDFAAANPDRHGIGRQPSRFRDAAALLPETAIVGYLSDVPVESVRGSTAFFGAQYALAPRVLVTFPGRRAVEWVIGNFSRPADYETLAREHGLAVVKDFGRGLVLFRGRGR